MSTSLLNISLSSSPSMFTFRTNILPLNQLNKRLMHPTTNLAITKSYKKVPFASIKNKHVSETEYRASLKGLRADLILKHVSLLMNAGCPSLMGVAQSCCELGIKVLSIYTRSENFNLAKDEVDFATAITKLDLDELSRNDIRVSIIGNRDAIPDSLLKTIKQVEETTKNNKSLHIIEAFDYNGRLDIVQACIALAEKVENGRIQPEEIEENVFEQELESKCWEYPNPDLVIRTGGKYSVDNFMLWQSAYSEICFVEKDGFRFDKSDFFEALDVYQKRNRRFGGSDKKKEN